MIPTIPTCVNERETYNAIDIASLRVIERVITFLPRISWQFADQLVVANVSRLGLDFLTSRLSLQRGRNVVSIPRKCASLQVVRCRSLFRLQKELMVLMMSTEQGVSAFPDGENLFKWIGTITGPQDTVSSE